MIKLVRYALFTNRQVLLFLTVGSITFALNSSLYTYFLKVLHFNYTSALSIAYVLALVFHFSANRKLTFGSCKKLKPQVIQYLLVALINYLLMLLTVSFLVNIVTLSPQVSGIIGMIVIVASGYVLLKFWVFSHQ